MVARPTRVALVSAAARIAVAGLTSLALVASHAAYRAWPAWRGVEIYLPVSLSPADPHGYVRIDIPAERLRVDVPGTTKEPPGEPFQFVRATGATRAALVAGVAGVRRLRGRDLVVQVEPDRPLWPQGPVAMRPVSVSDAPVAGAANLAGLVTRADEHGRLWLTFGSHQMAVPPEVAARAKPLAVAREPDRPPTAPGRPPDPGTFAIFRVLASGRATLAGLIVDGTRID